jgi:hypothetical protein
MQSLRQALGRGALTSSLASATPGAPRPAARSPIGGPTSLRPPRSRDIRAVSRQPRR